MRLESFDQLGQLASALQEVTLKAIVFTCSILASLKRKRSRLLLEKTAVTLQSSGWSQEMCDWMGSIQELR